MDPLAFDGRALGPNFAKLRDPLPEFTVLGGMMVTMTDVYHLLGITKSFASWKHGMKMIARYAADRPRHHRGTRLVLGNALAGRLYKSVLDRGIPVWLEAPARRLVMGGGKVVGIVHYIYHRSTWTVGNYCYLQDLFTAEEARGRGVARALIEAVYDRAKAAGASRVYWLTHETNTTAQALYDKVAARSGFIQYRQLLE